MAYITSRQPLLWRGYQAAKLRAQQAMESGATLSEDEAREAGSVADFGAYLSEKVRYSVQQAALAVPGTNYRTITEVGDVSDTKPEQIIEEGTMGEFLEVSENGQYHDTFWDVVLGATIKPKRYGRIMSIPWDAIINDSDLPARISTKFGQQAGRLRNKVAIQQAITNNPTLPDGRQLFNATDGNLGSTALTMNAAGATALYAAYMAAVATAVDRNGDSLGIGPRYLLVPFALGPIAKYLTSQPTIDNGSGAQIPNVAFPLGLEVVVEPSLSDSNNWFLIPDQAVHRTTRTVFLYGKEDPTIWQVGDTHHVIGGGDEDPFSVINDDYRYKGRLVMGAASFNRQGSFGAIVP